MVLEPDSSFGFPGLRSLADGILAPSSGMTRSPRSSASSLKAGCYTTWTCFPWDLQAGAR